jgi:hypothetical protein
VRRSGPIPDASPRAVLGERAARASTAGTSVRGGSGLFRAPRLVPRSTEEAIRADESAATSSPDTATMARSPRFPRIAHALSRPTGIQPTRARTTVQRPRESILENNRRSVQGETTPAGLTKLVTTTILVTAAPQRCELVSGSCSRARCSQGVASRYAANLLTNQRSRLESLTMQIPSAAKQRNSGTASPRNSRMASGLAAQCRPVTRNFSYQTRVSAMRFPPGCATERLSAIRGNARSIWTHGVHVAERMRPHRLPGSALETRSG